MLLMRFRRRVFNAFPKHTCHTLTFNMSNLETEHITGGSVRSARRDDGAKSSRTRCLHNYLSIQKPGHTTGRSVRSTRQSGRAGSSEIRCQQNYSPRKQKSAIPSKPSKKLRFNLSSEARISEILFKPTEEKNQRLTTGLLAVYHRGRSALCSWLPNSRTTPFCLCKPFSCKGCPGIGSGNKSSSFPQGIE